MTDVTDMDLVREYVRNHSESAFTELVGRHVNLVYSVALRYAGQESDAQDIAQAVFITLARKAAGLRPNTILAGWLYETTRFTAARWQRGNARRLVREQEAYMHSVEPDSPEVWQQLAPLLEVAMSQLAERDRTLLALRFYENKTGPEAAALMRIGEDTAYKRTARALEKLRACFGKHGIALSGTAIAGIISTHSIQVAPPALSKTIAITALAKSAATGTSSLALMKGALNIMTWSNSKAAIIAGLAVLMVGATVTVSIHEIRKPKFDPKDFWATSYPTASPEMMQYLTNSYGHPLNYNFPASPAVPCSISGLLEQCMEISGWRYLIDRDVSAGSVEFGHPQEMNGQEWVAAFEHALQSGQARWWQPGGGKSRWRHENLVLIRFPREKVVLVVPREKAAKYQ